MESLHRSLKHCYLRLSGAGSLANLASNLIDEFVPDQMMAYRQKNFRCSDMYKVFNKEVPYYLHNRPRTIVQHCLRAHEAASTYCMDDITMTGIHKFEVRSEQNQATWYKVDFGSSDRQPSCQCWSFRSSYLPCKHFFAIFRNTTMYWVDLAHRYQESPYMNLDVIQHCHVSVPPANGGDDTANDDSGHQQSFHARVERAEEEGIQCAQKKLREAIKQVEDASFLCAVTETVQKSTEMMKQILNNLLTGAVTENRLYVRQKQKPVKRRPNTRQLPPRKKRKMTRARPRHRVKAGINKHYSL